MYRLLSLSFFLFVPGQTLGEVRIRSIDYKDGSTALKGILFYHDSGAEKKPGIVMMPDGWGITEAIKGKAGQLARLGYAVFVADLQGNGAATDDPQAAAGVADRIKGDRKRLRARAEAAVGTIKRQPQVDSKRLAVIGYSAGGTAALDLARSGSELAGIISFHGDLIPADADGLKRFHGKIFIFHGADDDGVNADMMRAFEHEMRKAGVDWQLVKFGGAGQDFTNPKAGKDRSRASGFDAKADKRSFEMMKSFLEEALTPEKPTPTATPRPKGIPEKVLAVLEHIDKEKAAPKGYEGGRTFLNLEKHLPLKDSGGKTITYHEWDVNPHVPGVNRGAERLITGSDGSAYFTEDHYKTFKKIR